MVIWLIDRAQEVYFWASSSFSRSEKCSFDPSSYSCSCFLDWLMSSWLSSSFRFLIFLTGFLKLSDLFSLILTKIYMDSCNYFYIDSILSTLAWYKGSDYIRVILLENLSIKTSVRVDSYWNSIWIANEKWLINRNRKKLT